MYVDDAIWYEGVVGVRCQLRGFVMYFLLIVAMPFEIVEERGDVTSSKPGNIGRGPPISPIFSLPITTQHVI